MAKPLKAGETLVDDLSGADLDYWVAKAEHRDHADLETLAIVDTGKGRLCMLNGAPYAPSSDMLRGGEIMRRNWIGTMRPSTGQKPPRWQALGDMPDEARRRVFGPAGSFNSVVSAWDVDMLVAAMRVRVKMAHGESVAWTVCKS